MRSDIRPTNVFAFVVRHRHGGSLPRIREVPLRAARPRTNRKLPASLSGMRRIISYALTLLGTTALVTTPGTALAGGTKFGVATGEAVACSGPALEPVAHLSVYRGDTLIRRSSFPQGSRFRLVLRANRTYIISNQGRPGQYVGSPPFRVRSGHTTHVTVRDFCM